MSVDATVGAMDMERTLHERFGLQQFRPGQREVIENVLNHRDVLCVMPTGGGKSLCYQLPALLLDGLTLVVSPLIALMKDQVDVLLARGIRATLINSTLDLAEQRTRMADIQAGRYDLVYVAPERFRSGHFVEAMARIRPALLAVDEAHCISEWGHDFRPDYARIGVARRALGMPPCIALTATATDLVRRDISAQLDLRDPAQFVTGFDRPNLSYTVVEARKDADKLAAVADVLKREPGSAIIYASSRKRCEEVGGYLEHELKRSTVVYHAGMDREDRASAQDRFMSGEVDVVVATNAFGMGVDKADIRSVIHFNMPGTLEAYYQEAGRAGRDGLPARCVLLYAPGDRFLQEMFIENEYPPREMIHRVYDYLRAIDADPIELTQAEIKEAARIDMSEQTVGTALKILEGAGALERFRPRENMAIIRINAEPEEGSLVDRLGPQAHTQRIVLLGLEGLVNRRFGEPVYFNPDSFSSALGLDRTALSRAIRNLAAELPIDYVPPFRGNAVRINDRSRKARDIEIDFQALNTRKDQEYEKLERMVGYSMTRKCRRAHILNYFGDSNATHCGHCDNCGIGEDRPSAAALVAVDSPAGREVLLKILSGIARAKGRFGKTVVTQMLTGSGTEKMARLGLTRLSTYGVLKNGGFTQPELIQVIDALTSAGLIETEEVDRFKPIINLSPAGWDWLRGQGKEEIRLGGLQPYLAEKLRNGGLERVPSQGQPLGAGRPRSEPAFDEDNGEAEATNGFSSDPAVDNSDPLRARLKALRLQWAREANQKAYHIFTDAVLDILVSERPSTPQALAAIKGIGPSKLERYGKVILDAIHKAPQSSVAIDEDGDEGADQAGPQQRPAPAPTPQPSHRPTPAPAEPVPAPAPRNSAYLPTEEWTWRLLDRGFTLDEAAAIRGLEHAAIVRHATWMARQGKDVPLAAFLSPDRIERWSAWRRDRGPDAPPDHEEAAPGLWQLFLACRKTP